MSNQEDNLRNTPYTKKEREGLIEYYKQNHSVRDCSVKFKMSTTTVIKYMREAGIARTRSEACLLRDLNRGKGARWNGGRSLKYKPGYVAIYTGVENGVSTYRTEHILIAEKALGRKLKRGEVVHHINGDKLDNRNCNLLICSNPYHGYLHNKMARLYQQEHFKDI